MKLSFASKRTKRFHALDITPLIDVVFLLLIFFMLTSNALIQAGIRVRLPSTVESFSLPVERVDVFITSDDVIYCKGNEVTADELLLILRSERPHARSVVVYADLDCTHGKVVLVEDICRRVGFEQISVATRPLKNVK